MKALLWAVIGFVVVMWLLRGKTQVGTDSSRPGASDRGNGNSEPMIRCAHCGVHMPASEAVVAPAGTVFCSEEHRLRHAAR